MNFTIKQKLMLLGATVIGGLVIFGGMYGYGNSVNSHNRTEDHRIQDMKITMERINTGVLMARRREKDFLLRNDMKYVDKHRKDMQTNYALVSRLQGLARNDNMLATISDLELKLNGYENSFLTMVKLKQKVGLHEKVGLLGALRKSVHDAESDLKKYNKIHMTAKMLMMRRHEKDYLARKKEKYIGKMGKRQKEFAVLLANSGLPSSVQNKISANMAAYHRDFLALTEGMKAIDTEIARFRDVVHSIDPVMERLDKMVSDMRETNAEFQQSEVLRINGIIFTSLAVIGGIVVFLLIMLSRSIIVPLNQAVNVCREISEGKLDTRISGAGKDEVGQLMQALANMRDNLFNIVGSVNHAAENIANGSQEIAAGNANLSQRTEEQASSLEETASSMEEMTGTVKQNADSAKEAKQVADANRQRAATGAEVVRRTVNAMGEINNSSNRIADIIGTIDGIAFQTNLLALNAAVEAARAGEQGRGFAVVASEVRSLAQRSAEAAKEIKDLIEDSVGKVKVGNELVEESGKTLEEIIEGTQKVADIIAEIAAASVEQASGIDQVNNAITQMDNMTQDNAAVVEEAAASARSMQEQAEELNSLMTFFKINDAARLSGNTSGVSRLGGNGQDRSETARSTAKPAPVSRPVMRAAKESGNRKPAGNTSEWEQF